jgi:hypothetical protein
MLALMVENISWDDKERVISVVGECEQQNKERDLYFWDGRVLMYSSSTM